MYPFIMLILLLSPVTVGASTDGPPLCIKKSTFFIQEANSSLVTMKLYSSSSLHAVQEEAADVETPIISSARFSFDLYFIRFAIGNPFKRFYLIMDTGSDFTWLQCQPCRTCFRQLDNPMFKPEESSTSVPVPFNSELCESIDGGEDETGMCTYQTQYRDHSSSAGTLITENILLGTSLFPEQGIGCGRENYGELGGAAGIFGLGRGPLAFPSQAGFNSFSFCLVQRDSMESSTLEFGAINIPGGAITMNLVNNPNGIGYYVPLTGISINDENIPTLDTLFDLDHGGVVVDSGSSMTWLKTDAYYRLLDAFHLAMRAQRSSPIGFFPVCWDLPADECYEVPTITLHFGKENEERLWVLPTDAVLVPTEGIKFCFPFMELVVENEEEDVPDPDIIGNTQMQQSRMYFDLQTSRLGVLPNAC